MVALAGASFWAGALPRREFGDCSTMAYRTGRCTNDLYCSFASAKQNLQVPVASQFVCPQCGKPLVVPPPPKRALSPETAVIVGVLVVVGIGLFAAGALLNHPAAPTAVAGAKAPAPTLAAGSAMPATPPAVLAQAPATPAPGTLATPPVGASIVTAAMLAAQPAATPPVTPPPVLSPPGTAAPGTAPAVPSPAVPSPAVTAPAITRPATTARAGASPGVTIWSAPQQQAASPVPPQQDNGGAATPADGTVPPRGVPPMRLAMAQTPNAAQQQTQARLQAEAARQAARTAELEKRSAAAQAAAQKQKAQQLQAQDQKRRALAKAQADAQARADQQAAARQAAQDAARARIAAQQAGAATPSAPPPGLPPARTAQTGESRGFSSVPVEGGSPSYPDAYEADGRTGRVTVSCTISASGSPGGCRVVSSQGGIGFNNAVLSWLRSGRVRFAPILRNGEPQTETHSWTLNFQP
jgi:TonB family protein